MFERNLADGETRYRCSPIFLLLFLILSLVFYLCLFLIVFPPSSFLLSPVLYLLFSLIFLFSIPPHFSFCESLIFLPPSIFPSLVCSTLFALICLFHPLPSRVLYFLSPSFSSLYPSSFSLLFSFFFISSPSFLSDFLAPFYLSFSRLLYFLHSLLNLSPLIFSIFFLSPSFYSHVRGWTNLTQCPTNS